MDNNNVFDIFDRSKTNSTTTTQEGKWLTFHMRESDWILYRNRVEGNLAAAAAIVKDSQRALGFTWIGIMLYYFFGS